jgi:hypothetical protein
MKWKPHKKHRDESVHLGRGLEAPQPKERERERERLRERSAYYGA